MRFKQNYILYKNISAFRTVVLIKYISSLYIYFRPVLHRRLLIQTIFRLNQVTPDIVTQTTNILTVFILIQKFSPKLIP